MRKQSRPKTASKTVRPILGVADKNTKNGYDVLVLIGRFQPFHLGHLDLLKQAVDYGAKHIVILVGSASTPRNPRNPFEYFERKKMIRDAIHEERGPLFSMYMDDNISILPLPDKTYFNEEWAAQVNTLVRSCMKPGQKAAIFGYAKDANTSFYLNMFGANYGQIFAKPFYTNLDSSNTLDASNIRHILFNGMTDITTFRDVSYFLPKMVPEVVYDQVKVFMEDTSSYLIGLSAYEYICTELFEINKIKKRWEGSPYPPTFQTVDAMVVQSGHMLVVERGEWPAKGRLALPGGYIKIDEWPIQAAIRELQEETKINLQISKRALMGSLKASERFADPHRSLRGRVITEGHLFHLDPKPELPEVRGEDDAVRAFWIPMDDFHEKDAMEDHFFISRKLRGYLKDQP